MKHTQVSAAFKAKNWVALDYLVRANHQVESKDDSLRYVPIQWTGKYGEIANFLLSAPCLATVNELKAQMQHYDKPAAVAEFDAYIKSVETKMLCLMVAYGFTGVSYSNIMGYEAMAFFTTCSVVSSIVCRHANNFNQFLSNLYITLDDYVIKNLKCNINFDSKIIPSDTNIASRILHDQQLELQHNEIG